MGKKCMKVFRWSLATALIVVMHISVEIANSQQESRVELNTILMESTFKIEGTGSFGTAFILGRPYPSEPTKFRYVLVTAAHVLERIQGEKAALVMRQRKGEIGWERLPVTVQIRDGQFPRWFKHPHADVAVLYVSIPTGVIERLVSMTLLADDEVLAQFEVHPGDELNVLGYPLGFASNDAGFPILRSGKIASYPLLPTKETMLFLLDFRIFDGNSGGPVYFVDSNRFYEGSVHIGAVHFIIGLVTAEVRLTQEIQQLYGRREEVYPLGLAHVVHASLIREAINLLPPPDSVE